MANLRPLDQTFGYRGAGCSAKQAPLDRTSSVLRKDTPSVPAASTRTRHQPGIREYTDESCDLPNSYDIIQHLAESCRDIGGQHTGTDRRRMSSYASTAVGSLEFGGISAPCDTYEAIEADLDSLKREVGKLKEEHSRECSSINEFEYESAAVRLQRAHELLEDTVHPPAGDQLRAPALPSHMDFPALAAGKFGKGGTQHHAEPHTSYASAASVGLKDTRDDGPSTGRTSRADSKVFDMDGPYLTSGGFATTSQQAMTLTSLQLGLAGHSRHLLGYEEDQRSVIVSVNSERNDHAAPPGAAVHTMPGTPVGKSAKGAPRFAQPTASFARRAETVRKDSVSAASKSSPLTSPNKTVRGREANVGTMSAVQRQSKRKSLPCGWLGTPDPSPVVTHHVATITSSPVIEGKYQDMDNATTRNIVSFAKMGEVDVPGSPQLRKKRSSYMAPTAAAMQRSLATLGEGSPKRDESRVKPSALRINTNSDHVTILSSPDSNPMSAASSLVERSTIGSSVSPPSPQRFGRHPMRSIESAVMKASASPSSKSPRFLYTEKKTLASPKSPTKIPRARKPESAPLQSLCVNVTGVDPLAAVANTTTKRRTSHADILAPIFAKLDSQGLLKESPDATNVSGTKTKQVRIETTHSPVQNLPEESLDGPRQVFAALENVALLARQGMNVKKTIMPPQLYTSRQGSVASIATDPTLSPQLQVRTTRHDSDGIATAEPRPVSDPEHSSVPPQSRINTSSQSGVVTTQAEVARKVQMATEKDAVFHGVQPSTTLQPPPSLTPKPSPASSLRATAIEFTPIWQPQGLAQEFSMLSWQGSLDHQPDDEWYEKPDEVRRSIQTLREWKRRGLQSPTSPNSNRTSSPSKRAEQRFWGNLMGQPTFPESAGVGAAAGGRLPSRSDSGYRLGARLSAPAGADTVSPNGVQVGQVLKPSWNPGQKTMQWMLQDIDGHEKPVSFGRAPPPTIDCPSFDSRNEDNPTISPVSDDTSPLKSPRSLHWTIGASNAPWNYGWKGGDGREISFTGYGPHAESDPNQSVNMNFSRSNGHGSDYGSQSPNGNPWSPNGSGNISPTQKVWPRSRRQWAELAGYNKVPCGDIEITHAIETIPFGSGVTGYCNDCVGPSTEAEKLGTPLIL